MAGGLFVEFFLNYSLREQYAIFGLVRRHFCCNHFIACSLSHCKSDLYRPTECQAVVVFSKLINSRN